MRATKALIHLDRLYRNIAAVRERAGPKPLICMPVKADAYGHGALRVAGAALDAGVRYLAVATVREGAELREGGIGAPVLLLSVPLPGELDEALACGLELFVPDREWADLAGRAAAAAGCVLGVHLKIDTGMGRLGCRPEEAAELARYIAGLRGLRYAGTATHLAVSDSAEAADIAYTRGQLKRFREAVEEIARSGIDPGLVHAANSGAIAFHAGEDPGACLDMVRPGIVLYGYPPAGALPFSPPVEPLMELITAVVFIKRVRKGETLSYGRTWTAPADSMIATLPIGYADGLNRSLGGNHMVYIRGKPYPLVGRICMDQCMVDLGPDTDIGRWERVTIFGGQAPGAGEVASKLGTIPYEITCNINKRVPRIYEEG
jgi:alanine racemase